MADSFWKQVNSIIDTSDILLLVLDGRMVKETRNKEIEDKIKDKKKPIIYVVNKSDLTNEATIYRYRQRLRPVVFVSSKTHYGMSELKEKIHVIGTRNKIQGQIRVGVLGYPNVGKSSLINSMKGKKSAPTSALSGHTRSIRKVKTSSKIIMLDTPGVIPGKEKDYMKHSMIGSIDYTKTKEPELVVFELMENFPNKIESHYNVSVHEDHEETLEEIAIKKTIVKKGNIPDLKRMAIMILTQWQKGEIK